MCTYIVYNNTFKALFPTTECTALISADDTALARMYAGTVTCRHCSRSISAHSAGFQTNAESFFPSLRLDNRKHSSDNLRALFSILARHEMAEPPLKKVAPKRKCKVNEDWRRYFAWIAKSPDNDMAQCNLCATFRYHLVVARMFAVTKRVHATLSWRRERALRRVG